MEHFRKVWTDEIKEWIKTTKGMKTKDAYDLFLKTYPDITDVTKVAFSNMRHRLGCSGPNRNPNFSRKPCPLYAEHQKKGYVQIKVAQPNVWMSKAKWVYMETHPEEYEKCITERSNYIFLDGDNRNFSPLNIERVPLYIMGLFSLFGGTVYGDAELTRLRILQARLKYATMEAGEKNGLVKNIQCNGKHQRYFVEEHNKKQREYNSTPERRKQLSELAKKRRQRIKVENPAKYQEILQKHRDYMKTYMREYNKRHNSHE